MIPAAVPDDVRHWRYLQESLANAKVSARHNSLNHPSLAFFTVTPSTTVFWL